jgi:Predicted metal-dependent hydrolase
MPTDPVTDKRVRFDFDITFSNGGGLQGQDFRLDIDGDDISDEELGRYIIRDLRLLMVDKVKILNKAIITERHKRAAKAGAAATVSRIVDLSHHVRSGEENYPGLPAPVVSDHMSHEASRGRYAEDVTFQIGKVEMVANSGTAIDVPYHRYPDREDVGDMPIEAFADLEAVVIRLTGMKGRAITAKAIAATDVAGKAVLLDTGRGHLWGADAYLADRPFLTRDGAEHLVQEGAVLVGIDGINIDDTDDPDRPAHSILLAAGIPIVENLPSLSALPNAGFRFNAAPMRIHGIGAFPIRAWARLE